MAVMMILLMSLLGLQLLPMAVAAAWAPYVYGAALVVSFWMLRNQVRKLCRKTIS